MAKIKEKRIVHTIRFPTGTFRMVAELAKAERRSISAQVVKLVEDGLRAARRRAP